MSQLTDNLYSIASIKGDIKSAIEAKGVDMTGYSFPDYPAAISQISTGGGGIPEIDITQRTYSINTLYNSASFVATYAFLGCLSLNIVDLPECTIVGDDAFKNCVNLQYVNLPSCTAISTGAFAFCRNLLQIWVPELTQVLSVFDQCSMLSFIELPKCSRIFNYAFSGCSNLSMIILPSTTVCELYSRGLYNAAYFFRGDGSILVPSALVDTYKSANYWSDYASQIFPIE